jgi:cbb3-type cytochrome oxidase subunit 3
MISLVFVFYVYQVNIWLLENHLSQFYANNKSISANAVHLLILELMAFPICMVVVITLICTVYYVYNETKHQLAKDAKKFDEDQALLQQKNCL